VLWFSHILLCCAVLCCAVPVGLGWHASTRFGPQAATKLAQGSHFDGLAGISSG